MGLPWWGNQDLRCFLADEYHDRGRHEEAMDLIWTGFAEEPRLDGYEELKVHADRDVGALAQEGAGVGELPYLSPSVYNLGYE